MGLAPYLTQCTWTTELFSSKQGPTRQRISAPAKIGVALQSRSGSIFGVALRVARRLAIRSCAPACAPTLGAPRSDRAPTKNSKNVFSTPKNGSIWLKMAQKTKVKHLASRHFFCNKLPLSFVAENGVRCVFLFALFSKYIHITLRWIFGQKLDLIWSIWKSLKRKGSCALAREIFFLIKAIS